MILDVEERITDINDAPVQEIFSEKGLFMRVESPRWDQSDWRSSLRTQKQIYQSVFELAVKEHIQHLEIPLIGIHSSGVPIHRAAEALWESACCSDYDKYCSVLVYEKPGTVFKDKKITVMERFRQLYFERPPFSVFMRVNDGKKSDSDILYLAEEGLPKDNVSVGETAQTKSVFESPETIYKAAKKIDDSLATNLYAISHTLFFAPEAFIMNVCGMMPDNKMLVVFHLLDLAAVGGCEWKGHYEKDQFLICRLEKGCGLMQFTFPRITRTFDLSFFTSETIRDSFQGCIIGGALGDALGYPVEFLQYEAIVNKYGSGGIQDLEINRDGFAEFSDDTQMTLFTMDGLRQGICRAEYKGISAKPEWYISLAYQDWLSTQIGNRDNYVSSSFTDLYRIEKSLDVCRAPGNTCLSALSKQNENSINPPYSNKIYSIEHIGNDSKGCGGVMRVAPIGLMLSSNHWIGKEGAAHTAAEAAAITHGHPLGYLPASYLGELIHRITYRMDGLNSLNISMKKALDVIDQQFAGTEYLAEFDEIVQKAWSLARAANQVEYRGITRTNKDMTDIDVRNIQAIGGGWVGEEALAIALYCVSRYPYDFCKALRISVNHSGDSDSTGAITGNILGAYLGIERTQQQCQQGSNSIQMGQLELLDKLIYWTDMAYEVVMNGIHPKRHGAIPPENAVKYYWLNINMYAAIDEKTGTAYTWREKERRWKAAPGLKAELDWGSIPFHEMQIVDGFTGLWMEDTEKL